MAPTSLCQTAEIGYCPTSSQGTGRQRKSIKKKMLASVGCAAQNPLTDVGCRMARCLLSGHLIISWVEALPDVQPRVGPRMGSFKVYLPCRRLTRTRSANWLLSRDAFGHAFRRYARREQPEKSSDEALALATEVWEGVLQSVAKTIQRSNRKNWRIKNTEAYLFGAFHHRFNRALRKERRRREIIQYLPSILIWSGCDRLTIQRLCAIWSNRSRSTRPCGGWMIGLARYGLLGSTGTRGGKSRYIWA